MPATTVSVDDLVYRCVHCRAALGRIARTSFPCSACGLEISVLEGIPLLVRNRDSIERAIAKARGSGKASWYEAPQLPQLEGPYRHHILKRRRYVEGVLNDARAASAAPWTGLDLGCGDGVNLAWLARYFQAFYASDYNVLRLLRAARLQQARHLFMADVTDYPALDSSFDVIFFNHVLEHITDDGAALSELHRILKPGGLVVLGVPNEGAFFWQLAYRLQPRTKLTSDHVHFYTAQTIAERCRLAGFRILSVKHMGWGLPHWTLDAAVRGYKWVDDALEFVGARALPSQASSLYLCLSK